MKKAIFFCLLSINVFSQIKKDSILPTIRSVHNPEIFKLQALIVPVTLIGIGIIGLESHTIQDFNSDIKTEVNEHIDEQITIDDFSQYAPMVSVYALNALNVEGRHNFKERTVILTTAYAIMSSSIFITKSVSNVQRPDGTSFNSFPSGHTATAFMGAEFLRQEYKHKSIWYGVAGYSVAIGTGLFRVYNDRHWVSDVVTGAGIGILSTKIAYWLSPFLNNKVFKTKKTNKNQVLLVPYYKNKETGLNFVMNF